MSLSLLVKLTFIGALAWALIIVFAAPALGVSFAYDAKVVHCKSAEICTINMSYEGRKLFRWREIKLCDVASIANKTVAGSFARDKLMEWTRGFSKVRVLWPNSRRDSVGRPLVYIFSGNKNLNKKLITTGLATRPNKSCNLFSGDDSILGK